MIFTRVKIISGLAVICCVFCSVDLIYGSDKVVVTDSVKVVKTKFKGKKFNQTRRRVYFENKGLPGYCLSYLCIDDPAFKKEFPGKYPFIGNPSVNTTGLDLTARYSRVWLSGGFLGIEVNKKTLKKIIAKDIKTVEQGERGVVDVIWEPEWARITARFIVLPKDDKVYVEVAVEPKEEVSSLKIKLCCGSFGKGKYPDRWFSTPIRTVQQHLGKGVLDPKKEPWIFYFDTHAGGYRSNCALLYVPDEVEKVELESGKNKNIMFTYLNYPPSIRKMHFVLYSFRTDHKNQEEAYTYLKETGSTTLENLKKLFEEVF